MRDNAVKVPEIGVQSKSGSGISQQFKAKQSETFKRRGKRQEFKRRGKKERHSI